MRLFIRSLTDYTNGLLKGEWIDLEGCEIKDAINDYLEERSEYTGEVHEEYAVHDYEDFPDLGEHPDLDELQDIIDYVHKTSQDIDVIKAYYYIHSEFDKDNFEESYQGEFTDEKDFAYDLVESCYDLENTMGNLASYFDYEKFARDLFCGDYTSVSGGKGVYVFRNM